MVRQTWFLCVLADELGDKRRERGETEPGTFPWSCRSLVACGSSRQWLMWATALPGVGKGSWAPPAAVPWGSCLRPRVVLSCKWTESPGLCCLR